MNELELLLNRMGNITNKEAEVIQKAYFYVEKVYEGKVTDFKETIFSHALEVAFILTELHVDAITIEAALLHKIFQTTSVSKEEIRKNFGASVATILDSVHQIERLSLTDDSESSAIYLRKVLVGMAEDVRVLFVFLANHLSVLRHASVLPKKLQKQKANEAMKVFVPIAHRLGINSLKSELENLSLHILKPQVYEDILERLNATSEELKDVLFEMQDSIRNILIEHHIKFHVKSRVKSVYSIYNKLNHGKKWNQIYDILAMRIIVDQVSDCYTVLGLIHAKYRPIPGRFKDYIAMPKENMYQSLHTGVFGVDGERFEIQIRTEEMDEIAEKGIASHWSYKEQGVKKVQSLMEQKLEVFRNFVETSANESDIEFENLAQNDFLNDFIYVFTPKGDVMELPKGATPVDFAYRIHSGVGEHVVSAIVNDSIVPLNYELHNQDMVQIKTNPQATPNKEWLNFVKTSHAKTRIKAFFNKRDREVYVSKGKEILEKELRKRKSSFDTLLNASNIKKICQDLKLKNLEDIYFAIGTLRYTAGAIIDLTGVDKRNVPDVLIEKMGRGMKDSSVVKSGIIVAGESNVLTSLAKCCHPIFGDDIKGYITKGEGVSVHRSDCVNIANKTERLVEVSWGMPLESTFLSDIFVAVLNHKNYLLELVAKASGKNLSFDSIRTKEMEDETVYEITVRVKNKEELEGFLSSLEALPFVRKVGRK